MSRTGSETVPHPADHELRVFSVRGRPRYTPKPSVNAKVRRAYGRTVLKRRRKRRTAPPSYDAIIGESLTRLPQVPAVSPQQVWNFSVAQVRQGLTRMEEKARRPPLSETDMRFIAENLIKAMWSFEWLSQRSGGGGESARVLEQSVKEILEGLRNDQAERVIAGLSTTSAELKKIISS